MKSTEVEVVCPNLVDGIWVHSGASRRFERRNPADFNDVIGHVPLSSREDVDCAVAAAERALPIWRRTPAPVRGRILSKVARSLDDHLEEVATLLTREEGKLLAESRAEVRVAINALEYFASLGRRLAGESLPSERERHFVVAVEDRVDREVLRRPIEDVRYAAGEDDRQPFLGVQERRTRHESCDHSVDGANSDISAAAVAAQDLIKLIVGVGWLLHAAKV